MAAVTKNVNPIYLTNADSPSAPQQTTLSVSNIVSGSIGGMGYLLIHLDAGIISVVENYSPAVSKYVGLPLLDRLVSESLPYSFQFSVTRPFTYNLSRPDLVEIVPLANRDDFYVKMKSTTYVPIDTNLGTLSVTVNINAANYTTQTINLYAGVDTSLKNISKNLVLAPNSYIQNIQYSSDNGATWLAFNSLIQVVINSQLKYRGTFIPNALRTLSIETPSGNTIVSGSSITTLVSPLHTVTQNATIQFKIF